MHEVKNSYVHGNKVKQRVRKLVEQFIGWLPAPLNIYQTQKQLIERYLVFITKHLYFIEPNGFFAPDTPVGTVIADIQQFCHLIYKRKVQR